MDVADSQKQFTHVLSTIVSGQGGCKAQHNPTALLFSSLSIISRANTFNKTVVVILHFVCTAAKNTFSALYGLHLSDRCSVATRDDSKIIWKHILTEVQVDKSHKIRVTHSGHLNSNIFIKKYKMLLVIPDQVNLSKMKTGLFPLSKIRHSSLKSEIFLRTYIYCTNVLYMLRQKKVNSQVFK